MDLSTVDLNDKRWVTRTFVPDSMFLRVSNSFDLDAWVGRKLLDLGHLERKRPVLNHWEGDGFDSLPSQQPVSTDG